MAYPVESDSPATGAGKPAKRSGMVLTILRSVFIVTALASLGGCGETVLSPIGPIGAAERTILLDAVAIMLAIVVPTIAATLAFAWWFRAGNRRARYLPTWQYSGKLELLDPSNCALIIIDHQPAMTFGVANIDRAEPTDALQRGKLKIDDAAPWMKNHINRRPQRRQVLAHRLSHTPLESRLLSSGEPVVCARRLYGDGLPDVAMAEYWSILGDF